MNTKTRLGNNTESLHRVEVKNAGLFLRFERFVKLEFHNLEPDPQ